MVEAEWRPDQHTAGERNTHAPPTIVITLTKLAH
jgi:hypothetical protein